MIIVKLMGGLGNQMFQYAFGRNLAIKTQSKLKLDLSFLLDKTPRKNFTFRNYALNIFNIQEDFATSSDIAPFKISGNIIKQLQMIAFLNAKKKYYVKEELIFYYKNLSKLKGDFYIEGYWQNEKYFKDIGNTVREDFTFKSPIDSRLHEIVKVIMSTNSVSISIRRGDYLKRKDAKQIYYLCNAKYYQNATEKIARLTPNPYFFVFSDDVEWCKNNLPTKYPIQIISSEYAGENFQNYFRLITICKHHIIANSTFPWWAAWLNNSKNKIIISPRYWYQPSIFSLNNNKIIPKEWIKI